MYGGFAESRTAARPAALRQQWAVHVEGATIEARVQSGLMGVRHGTCSYAPKLSCDHRHACPDWIDMEGDRRFRPVSPLRLIGLGPPPKLAETDGRWSIQSNPILPRIRQESIIELLVL
jgi:hypothetical protein